MKLAELREKSVLILGLGQEGRSTLRWLRAAFPEKTLGAADQLPLPEIPPEAREQIEQDSRLRSHLGPGYLASLDAYEVIVKSPGIPVTLPEYRRALEKGKIITSHTALAFANFPGKIIGVTGTKGKSTTSSLLSSILKKSLPDTRLVGNIGAPALEWLPPSGPQTVFVYELSSHQLEGLRQSPPIAVLLNVVPEHLDYYESLEQYVAAKENITRYQTENDWLIYDADHALPREIAARSKARRIACSLEAPQAPGCFLSGDWVVWRSEDNQEEPVVRQREVPLLGRFNLANVLAAVAAAKLLRASSPEIAGAVRQFQPLEHRLEWVGTYDGVTYYDDSIATVPEAAIAALDALGGDVETLLLGGTDRHLDFSLLAKRILRSNVKTLLLFPATGERIWQAISEADPSGAQRFRCFFVNSMEEAVALAKQHTGKSKICLHSPASPSFGLFRNYRERGEQFQRWVTGKK